MIQRGQDSPFTLKAGHAGGIVRELLRQDLDRDVTSELGIGRTITAPMPPSPGLALIR
jgi:hypothetical protein